MRNFQHFRRIIDFSPKIRKLVIFRAPRTDKNYFVIKLPIKMTETAKKQDLSLLPTTTMTPDPDKEDDGFTLVQARNSSAERLKSTTTGTPPVEMTRKTSTGTDDDASTSNSFGPLSDPEGEDEDEAEVEEVDAEIVALVPSKVDKSKKKKKKNKNKNKNTSLQRNCTNYWNVADN